MHAQRVLCQITVQCTEQCQLQDIDPLYYFSIKTENVLDVESVLSVSS